MNIGETKQFNYTGGVQSFTVPHSGIYKLEVWGAKGGDAILHGQSSGNRGGKGGYVTGTVNLKKGTTLYIVAGQAGATGSDDSSTHRTSYNGGGKSHGGLVWFAYFSGGGGGGATHIATTNRGELKNYQSYQSEVLIVAGGGGGASKNNGTDPGNYNGQNASGNGGYSFGVGQNADGPAANDFAEYEKITGAGGGGWSGGSRSRSYAYGGTSYASSSLSDVVYTNGSNSGNGYAKITFIKKKGIKIGNTDYEVYVGSKGVDAIYLGGTEL